MKKLRIVLFILFCQVTNSSAQMTISAQVGDSILFNSKLEYYSTYNWDFGNGMYSFDENPIFIYNQSGTYEVSVTAYDACCPNKDTVNYFIVYIGNGSVYFSPDSFAISPNPAFDVLNIHYTNFSNSTQQIVITKLSSGTTVKSEFLNPANQLLSIDVSEYIRGFYCITFLIDQAVSEQKYFFVP